MKKPTKWVSDSIKAEVRSWPEQAKQDVGSQLNKVEYGGVPAHYREMPVIGSGVKEIRIVEDGDQYRLVYVAKFLEAIYVLHAITRKKTQKTSRNDVELARWRYRMLIKERERFSQ